MLMLGARDEIRRVLLSTDAVGGVWTHTLELARGLRAVGIETVLVVLGPPLTDRQRAQLHAIPALELIETDLPLDWLASDAQAIAAAADALAALALDRRIDLAHLHAPALAATGTSDWPMPVVAALHSCVGTWWAAVHGGPPPPDLAWRTLVTRDGLAIADAVVAPSRSFAATAAAYYRFARVTPVLNGRTPPSLPSTDRARAGVLTAGRLWDAGKDIDTLDEAARLAGIGIAAAGPSTGPHGETCRASSLEHLGPLDSASLERRLAATSVFVSAAVYEPFGLAVLEAAQAGAALVLSDIPAHRELWDGAALLVPPRRPDLLAEALTRVTADSGLGNELARRALERAKRYGTGRMTNAMLTVYRRALARSRRRHGRAGRARHAA